MTIKKKHIDSLAWLALGFLLLSSIIGENIGGKIVGVMAICCFLTDLILFLIHWRWYQDILKKLRIVFLLIAAILLYGLYIVIKSLLV